MEQDITTKTSNPDLNTIKEEINSNEVKEDTKPKKVSKIKPEPQEIPLKPFVQPINTPVVQPINKPIDSYQLQQQMMTQMLIDSMNKQKQNYVPNSAIETAHILLSNSASSDPLIEIDKEIKLANFTDTEKFLETQYMGAYQDMLWMMEQQKVREIEADRVYGVLNDTGGFEKLSKEINESVDSDNFYDTFDAPGTLRKTRTIATISRGYLGFERTKQVETINKSENLNIEKSERKPGFMDKISGWGNKNN